MAEKFVTKKGQVIHAIASDFMHMRIGDKVPSFTDYQEQLEVARGTVQNAIAFLRKEGCFDLQARGHLGTYVTAINYRRLQKYALSDTVMGTMTLPYSKCYEGLATGIYEAFRESNVRLNLAYIRGSKERIQAVVEQYYRFAVISKFAAQEAIANGDAIEMVADFGAHTYLSAHVLVCSDPQAATQLEGKRVAIDYHSIDQYALTEQVIAGHQVELVQMQGYRILSALRRGEVDVGVWNVDELEDNNYNDLHYRALPVTQALTDMSTAVIVVHKEDESLKSFFRHSVDCQQIVQVQGAVKRGELTPQY